MEPIRVAICDDLPGERENLVNHSAVKTSTLFSNGEELLKAFGPDTFDLLLMDIYMDGMTSVETV